MRRSLILSAALTLLFAGAAMSQTHYIGVYNEDITTSCASCHGTVVTAWEQTGHATTHDSTLVENSHYGYNCFSCHNTGWDEIADNGSFDESIVMDTSAAGDFAITNPNGYEDMKNVQCESCHGPVGSDSTTVDNAHMSNEADLSAEACGICHEGAHHPYMEQWSASGHATSAEMGFVVGNPECVHCHVAGDFIEYAKDPENYEPPSSVNPTPEPITCAACHEPHSNEYPGQLRFDVTGDMTICDHCHNGHVGDSVDYTSTPHHQTSELMRDNAAKFGYQYDGVTYSNSAHTSVVSDGCIGCHVHMTGFDGVSANTSHEFEPRVEACAECPHRLLHRR